MLSAMRVADCPPARSILRKTPPPYESAVLLATTELRIVNIPEFATMPPPNVAVLLITLLLMMSTVELENMPPPSALAILLMILLAVITTRALGSTEMPPPTEARLLRMMLFVTVITAVEGMSLLIYKPAPRGATLSDTMLLSISNKPIELTPPPF
jgi:hypothetical protein